MSGETSNPPAGAGLGGAVDGDPPKVSSSESVAESPEEFFGYDLGYSEVYADHIAEQERWGDDLEGFLIEPPID